MSGCPISKVVGIHSQSTFRALRTPAGRSSSGPIRVSYVRDCAGPNCDKTQVAYSIGRRFGNAVERNRCRRRLKSTVREIEDEIGPGAYLVSVDARGAELGYDELKSNLRKAITAAYDKAVIREDRQEKCR